MKFSASSTPRRLRFSIGVVLLGMTCVVPILASDLTIYSVGPKSSDIYGQFDLRGEFHVYEEDGTLLDVLDAPDVRSGSSLATDGTSLFVAEFGQAIEKYALDGTYLGQFADVSAMAGNSPGSHTIEADLAGNIYSVFAGNGSAPRTSFRLSPDGTVLQAFAHPSLVFPRGIDAAGDGTVYILNSAAVGIGNRLFEFDPNGNHIANHAIPAVSNPSDMAINELTQELFIADFFGDAIHVYDIAGATPEFLITIPTPDNTNDVFVEQSTNRIFGTYTDVAGDFRLTGFEVGRDGTILSTFDDPFPADESIRSLVAIPSPSTLICDFDLDGACDLADIDMLLGEGPIDNGVNVTIGSNDQFDLNGDGMIDSADLGEWLDIAAAENGFGSPYKLGDANLDGFVDASDFNIWNEGKFTMTTNWSEGNFNGDGFVDTSDFNIWNEGKFTASDVASVPEPATSLTLLFGVVACILTRRRVIAASLFAVE